MQELAFIAISSLLALLIVAMAALRGWDGWLALKRAELAHPTDSVPALGGMIEMAEDIFLKPARLGTPEYRGQLADVVRSPRYATVLGLLLEAKKQYLRGHIVTRQDGSVKAVWQRMKEWFLGNF